MLSVPSPLGDLTIWASPNGIVRVDFVGMPEPVRAPDSDLEAEAARQLSEYFARRRKVFDLPLDLRVNGFLRDVLAALGDIPYGQTRSYGEVARTLGKPGAARAVGGACRRNPVPILIPCHRVIGAGGDLVGFAGKRRALGVKERLLELERAE